jgi:hypothetical protein
MSIVGIEKNVDEGKLGFYTFQDLVDVCGKYPEKLFRFKETDYYPNSIESWRGVYSLASMDYTNTPKTGDEVANTILTEIEQEHTAWKGGEYSYSLNDDFYISEFGRCEEHKIYGYEVNETEVILLTEYDPY